MSVTPNTNMTGATTDETIDSIVSANRIRRISRTESSELASGRCLSSQKSHAKELAKLKVGISRPIARRFCAGATIGISWRQQSPSKPARVKARPIATNSIQEPIPTLMNICIHAEARPIGPRQTMPNVARTRLAMTRYCMAETTVFQDDAKAL
jgi:hypothetical protein